MKNLKIRVNNEAESKEAQELFFELGATLGNGDRHAVMVPGAIGLSVIDGLINFVFNQVVHSDITNAKEITLPELRAMAYPMKEYLMPSRNYEYILTDAREALEPHAEDWIEIPEWANYAYNNDQGVCFLKSEIGYNHPLLIWKRATHPEELPFVDDEPKYTDDEVKYMDENGQGRSQSLNDQYAEIEQVRQDEKQERNSSAWDVQIGGNHYKQFKIQPMQFALENKLDAAQHNVIKYIMRHSFKNGKQDLEKAKHYIDLMIEFYYGENNND